MNKGAGLVTASSTDCGRSAVALEKELFEKEELKIRYYEPSPDRMNILTIALRMACTLISAMESSRSAA